MYHDAYWCKSLGRYTDFDYILFSINLLVTNIEFSHALAYQLQQYLFTFAVEVWVLTRKQGTQLLPYGMSKPGP